MKIISQVNWSYTLYEDDDGSYVMSVVVPSSDAAWAVYEKEFRLTSCQKILLKVFPSKAQMIANRFLQKEKILQASGQKR